MKFVLEIITDNDAFAGEDRQAELARIMTKVSEQVNEGMLSNVIRDYNGNFVGNWSIR